MSYKYRYFANKIEAEDAARFEKRVEAIAKERKRIIEAIKEMKV